jgi:single-strand DNA-binding protein
MNNLTAMGMCWKPEVKATASGMMLFSCGLGMYNGNDKAGKAQYFTLTVKAFKEVAEAAGDAVQEKDNLIVTGRLSQESWEDKDGKKQYKMVMIADSIAKDTRQFVKRDVPAADPAAAFGTDVTDEEAPF